MEITQELLLYVVCGLIVVVFLLIIFTISLAMQLKKQRKRYDMFMGKGRRPSTNLETKLENFFRETKEIDAKYGKLLDMVTDIDQTLTQNIQKVGLVRYNPFTEMGGNLCFALALLDGKDNGVVINGIHSRTGSFTYAKSIEMGVSIYLLSDEEIQAVELAKKNAYAPLHEKVIKVKVKREFKKKQEYLRTLRSLQLDRAIVEEVEPEPEVKGKRYAMGDVTSQEKDLIFEDEQEASRIAQTYSEDDESE
ncbi:MAG: DUF4446 family protein [Bacillota bacterium]